METAVELAVSELRGDRRRLRRGDGFGDEGVEVARALDTACWKPGFLSTSMSMISRSRSSGVVAIEARSLSVVAKEGECACVASESSSESYV